MKTTHREDVEIWRGILATWKRERQEKEESMRIVKTRDVEEPTGRVLMECGCASTGYLNGDKTKPVCVPCYGIRIGADRVAKVQPDLKGRIAKCAYNCGSQVESSIQLAFFEWKPEEPFDAYYCGCRGWD